MVKKFPAFYGTEMFLAGITKDRQMSISNQIQPVNATITPVEDKF
jgi:hypothetical protein